MDKFQVVVNAAEHEAEGEEIVAEFDRRSDATKFAQAQQRGQTALNYFVRKATL